MKTPVALVTGAGSGLGAATAAALAAKGYVVVGVDRVTPASPPADLEDLHWVAADVTDEAQLHAAVHQAAALGDLRVAVACAGVAASGRTLGRSGPHPLEPFEQSVAVNLIGSFNTLRLSAAAMAENAPIDGERGVIVLTSSVAAFDGQVGQIAYAASKAGVAGMTLPAARDLGRVGIRVVAIAPGTFDTPMLAGLTPQAREALAAQIPQPSRPGAPSEFAALVVHVTENAMLNGEVIRLDGGLRMPYLP